MLFVSNATTCLVSFPFRQITKAYHRPQGLGCMAVGIFGGRFQDWYFRRMKRKLNFHPKHHRDLDGFPIERVRFATVPYYIPFWVVACVGYGFMLQHKVNLAGPLVLSFFIGAGTQFSSQTCQLILVDMFSSNAGASSASVSSVIAFIGILFGYCDMLTLFSSRILSAALSAPSWHRLLRRWWTPLASVAPLSFSCPFC